MRRKDNWIITIVITAVLVISVYVGVAITMQIHKIHEYNRQCEKLGGTPVKMYSDRYCVDENIVIEVPNG